MLLKRKPPCQLFMYGWKHFTIILYLHFTKDYGHFKRQPSHRGHDAVAPQTRCCFNCRNQGKKSICKGTNGQNNFIANSAVKHYHPKNGISTHNLANLSLYDHYLTIVCLFVNNFNIFDKTRTMYLTNFNLISEQKIIWPSTLSQNKK